MCMRGERESQRNSVFPKNMASTIGVLTSMIKDIGYPGLGFCMFGLGSRGLPLLLLVGGAQKSVRSASRLDFDMLG